MHTKYSGFTVTDRFHAWSIDERDPFSSCPPFAGATLGCYNVTSPQFTVDLHEMGCNDGVQ